jgi:hypothetical protein
MNAKAKRRAIVPETSRQESAAATGAKEAARAAEGRAQAAEGFPQRSSLVLSDHLPASAFVRLEVPCSPMLPCNPSIAKDGDGNLRCMIRAVNYELGEEDGIWFRGDPAPNTVNYLADLANDLTVKSIVKVDDVAQRASRLPCRDGLEDARLFWFLGRWCFTASGLHHGPRVRTTMALCALDGDKVSSLEFLHSPHNAEMEKNWMPCVADGWLGFIYLHHPVESYEVHPVRRRLWLSSFPELQKWSGGSQIVPYDGERLGVVHQRRKHKNRVYYTHRLVKYNSNLEPIHAGREFYFRGEQIEFCAGLVPHNDGFVLSFGVKDREAWLVSLKATEIASLLA